MDEIDIRIDEILNGELMIPESFMRMVERTLNNLPERPLKHKKRIAKIKACLVAVCCTMFMTTGIAFANEIIAFIKNVFNNSNGIDKAVQNGYIQELEENIVESNDTEISVENFLMDDFNLSFTFNVKLNNEEIVEDISKIEFCEMLISDENKNILYADNKQLFDTYCNENNLNYEFSDIVTGINKRINKIYNNNIEMVYNFYTDRFPKSKKIYINIYKIKYKREYDKIIKGKWKLEVDVPEKFYSRKCQVYSVIDCNIPEINSIGLEVYNTGTKFEFDAKFEAIDDEGKNKNEIMDQLKKIHEEYVISGKKMIENIYIKGDNDKVYYPIQSSAEDLNYNYRETGEITYRQTFDLINTEAEKILRIYFDIQLPNKSKHIEIVMKRN